MTRRFLPLDPLEIACNLGLGPAARDTGLTTGRVLDGPPRRGMEHDLLAALSGGLCLVSFSGGRDSSAVLAVASDVARREGLPLPVPVTLRFPGSPRAQEDEWQELVVRHLRLSDWQKVDVTDELDLVGSSALAMLRRHGLPVPPQLQSLLPAMRQAAGGTLLTGTGGDELFTPWSGSRATALRRLLRRRDKPALVDAVLRVGPPAGQRLVLRHRLSRDMPYLRPQALNEVAALMAPRATAAPDRQRALRTFLAGRNLELVLGNLDVLGAAHGCRVAHPLLSPDFVATWSSDAPATARAGRTEAMAWVVGDLLPPALLSRSTKATFDDAFWGPQSQAFARTWDGSGVDRDVVDPAALAELWRAGRAPVSTWALLQQAALHRAS